MGRARSASAEAVWWRRHRRFIRRQPSRARRDRPSHHGERTPGAGSAHDRRPRRQGWDGHLSGMRQRPKAPPVARRPGCVEQEGGAPPLWLPSCDHPRCEPAALQARSDPQESGGLCAILLRPKYNHVLSEQMVPGSRHLHAFLVIWEPVSCVRRTICRLRRREILTDARSGR